VLGAGPGGLSCAHELAEAGYRVTVLERFDYVGGLSLTVERNGFRFDLGGHRWFTKNEALNGWFKRLMDGRLVVVERTSRILFNGKFFDYPISIGNVLKTAGIATSLRCVVDYAATCVKNMVAPAEIRTMKDAFTAQFGAKLYDMFFRRYSEKVWGRSCSEMSADWVSQRSKGLSIWTTIANALLKPKKKAQSLIETFLYPRLGYADICERMREVIQSKPGNAVRLECDVRKVDLTDPKRPAVSFTHRGATETIECDWVVSTIALTGLLGHAVVPKPPTEVIEASKSLEFRSVICVNLMLDMPRMTKDTWIYCHDEGLGFARLHEPKNWSPAMVPDASKTSVVLEYFCTTGDEVWNKSDDAIVAWAVDDLARLKLITKDKVLGGFCTRAKEAYPVYSLGYEAKLKAMKDYVLPLERLAIVGRGGTFRYNNADHSIEMGLLTAQMIRGLVDKADVMSVNTDLEYGEKGLVMGELPDAKTPVGGVV
jgi:protoporphyrinogen oxidase